MSETLDHIIRHRIPWQTDKGITECGKQVAVVKAAISWDAFAEKFKREGQQRAAMTTCMTCWGRYSTLKGIHPGWAVSPSQVIGRECQRIEYRDSENQLDDEFRAIAALIEAHRDEFEGFLNGLKDTVSLAERRRQPRPSQSASYTPRPL